MDSTAYFEKFYENIKLTPAQREDAVTKFSGVSKKLHDHYYPESEYDGSTKLLIGSYGKHTHIRPARDIDVIFILPPEKYQQYADNQSNGQSQLLQDVKGILEHKYPNTSIRAFGKVVVLEFSDTKHDVELLPAWENEDSTFTIPNSEDGGSWERWDPRAELKKIEDSETESGQTRFLIRVIKKWSENCSADIKSYQIEDKVVDYFSGQTETKESYSLLVANFLEYFYQTSTDEKMRSHLSTALNRAKKANDFEAEDKAKEATDEWKKIFGDDFPSAEVEKSIVVIFSEIISKLQSRFPASTEEYLDQKYGIAIAINPTYSLTVDVNINQNGWRQNRWLLSEFQKRGYRIQRRASLLFKIISNNVPEPYDVKWKVRNFGEEARDLGALRGQITDDDGSETKKESTLYHGEHYVECYIIKNGQCVATGHVFVPIE